MKPLRTARRSSSGLWALLWWAGFAGPVLAGCGSGEAAGAPDALAAEDSPAADAAPGDAPAADAAPGDAAARFDLGDAPARADGTAGDTAAGSLHPVARVATQNAGTSRFLDLLERTPLRPTCEETYSNNLCTVDTEAALGATVAAFAPDIQMFEEVFDQRRCAETDWPPEASAAPFACSAGATPQLERVLPPDYAWGCAAGYPDNCIAFRPAVFVPVDAGGADAACAGRDCSALVVSNPAPCGRDGRLAYLRGRTAHGRTVLVVVHTNAGTDRDCRAQQLQAIEAVLLAEPADTAIFMAGDFNFDPVAEQGADRDAFDTLVQAVGLTRLADDGNTHRLYQADLDLVLVRGWPAATTATCHVAFADEGQSPLMLDHAYVACGAAPTAR